MTSIRSVSAVAAPSPPYTDADTFVVAPGLASADLGGESVVLDPVSGRYFGLNEVAARILSLVGEPRRLDQVVEVLAAEYDAPPGRLRADAEQFLGMLASRGLVRVEREGQ